ncbi:MAG: 4Fe-4S dicluster domain-containing protein [Desulfofustis sp.]|jgi:electron transport complex protein RnfC|nr:4Fe-4S dicluster domain-containing protein [Desulfofustis sp.]
MQGLLKIFSSKPVLPAVPDYDPVIRQLDDPEQVTIPLDYPGHIHYLPTVKAGDRVRRGQVIGRSRLGNCTLASISGTVRDISTVWTAQSVHSPAIVIDNDGTTAPPPEEMLDGPVPLGDPFGALARIREAGVNPPWRLSGRDYTDGTIANLPRIEAVIVTGIQEEPTILTSQLLLEQRADTVAEGLRRTRLLLPDARLWLTVPEQLFTWAETRFAEHAEIVAIPDQYGGRIERELVARLIGRRIPNRHSFISHGLIVQDVEYLVAMVEALDGRSPFLQKCLTISGPSLDQAVTLRFPLGSSLRHILHSQGLSIEQFTRPVVGGPMKGVAQYSDLTPITYNSGLYLVAEDLSPFDPIAPCIFCGRCTRVCPARIQVHLINRMIEFGQIESTHHLHPEACHECGLCAYVCPAERPIVQLLHFCNHEMSLGERHVWSEEGQQ